MYYLALNVLFSSFFILCIKWAKSRGEEIINIGALNYLSAAVLGIVMYVRSAEPLDSTAALLGAVNGGCYFVAFFFLIAAISWKGATNLAAVSRLSILMPVALGVAWLGERPDTWQAVGIVMACMSLLLISGRRGSINDAEEALAAAGGEAWGVLALELVEYTTKNGRNVSYTKPIIEVGAAVPA